MAYFFCKLIPPRPTFAQDMTAAEADLMQRHVAYWKELAGRGIAVIFGPVADPNGAWGAAIIECEKEADVSGVRLNDPTVKANVGFNFEIYLMPRAILRK